MEDDDGQAGAGARPRRQRAGPVTLGDHLGRGYAAQYRLDGSDSEAVDDVIGRLRAAMQNGAAHHIPRSQVVAERARLRLVEARCAVSRTHRAMLDVVLGDA